jgi:hypothetical protein
MTNTAVKVSIRRYAEDHQGHAYVADELADGWSFAEPVCAPWEHAIPHPRRAVSSADLPSLGGMHDRCPGCSVWMRNNRHTVVVRGTVTVR